MSLEEYYGRRAEVYEEIYRREEPQRRSELAAIAAAMQETLAGRRVLEVACGTGYWTVLLAPWARHIVAVDLSPEMLSVARAKGLPRERVDFRQGDAYALAAVSGQFDGGLANFWLSHVPRARLAEFLHGLHQRLGRGAAVFMADNLYMPGVGGELLSRPGAADTFKRRQLPDGSTHEILKNYYDSECLQALLGPWARGLRVFAGQCFWWVCYEVS